MASVLLIVFSKAPLAHFHHDDEDAGHGHARGAAHAHLALEDGHGPELEEEDHDSDARFLDWLAGDGTAGTRFEIALSCQTWEFSLEIHEPSAQAPAARSHDPPGLASLPGRSPPA